jgi:hypothetical protein
VQAALAAMMQLELPHVNVLTKMDLLKRSSAEVEQCVVCAYEGSDPQLTGSDSQVPPTERSVLLARAAAPDGRQVRQAE